MPCKTKITPVILSGGSGTRLWPMSRQHYPKQLLPLISDLSLLQETLGRFADQTRFAAPVIVTNEALRFIVAEQARSVVSSPGMLLLEPVARNTAPALAAAALAVGADDPDALLLVVPSDHVIRNVDAFLALVDKAAAAAQDGFLATFSITPSRAETGFGYIKKGEPLLDHPDLFRVSAFVEKPDAARAAAFVASGDYFWNGGMFLFPAKTIIAELETHAPEILAAVRKAVENRKTDLDFVRLDEEAFSAAPSISIDHAVMEKTDLAVTIPCDIGWSDVGAWNELWDITAKDENNNALQGDVIAEDSKNCLIRSEGALTCAIGVEDLTIVTTPDAVLVMGRDKAQDLKKITTRLIEQNRPEMTSHTRVYRPWGFYQSLHDGERFQVKRLTVNPGAKLSLQKHYHRAEHWVVVNGAALVTRDKETLLLRENESVYLPLGCVHRLENPGSIPLNVIEVQSGSYLGEDDIVRLEDTYGR